MALIRSESLTNLPIPERDARTGMPEDIRNTWAKKSKKVASLTGAHVCEFQNLRLEQKNEQPEGTSICAENAVMESEPFLLCGNMWSLKIFPHGVDEDSEFLGVQLQNRSDETVNAYYTLSIKRSDQVNDSRRLNMWVDPDVCSLVFQPWGTEDSAWGVVDFLPLQSLYSPGLGYMDLFADIPEELLPGNRKQKKPTAAGVAEGKDMYSGGEGTSSGAPGDAVVAAVAADANGRELGEAKEQRNDSKGNTSEGKDAAPVIKVPCDVFVFRNARGEPIYDRLFIEVQMMVYGEVSLKAHPITQAIEKKNASEAELIALADLDLDLIRQAAKGGGGSLAQLSAQQDNILAKLCPPAAATAAAPRTADDKGRKNTIADSATARPGSREASRPGSRPGSSSKGSRPSSATGRGSRPISAKVHAVNTIEEKDSIADGEDSIVLTSSRAEKNRSSIVVSTTVKYS